MFNSPQGYFKVNDRIFTSKMEAFLHASSIVDPRVSYHFYDEVWDSTLATYTYDPTVSLESLYKIRAQQIRDNYDYLILNFSGGADSTTILETFLKNNIKLDEVFVRWSKHMINSDKYTPNSADTSATNMLSEWDFSIAPKLEYLKRNYPNIKITIGDWVDMSMNTNINDDLLFKQNHNFGIANYGFSEMVSASTVELGDKGKRVANIFGIDKPVIAYDDVNDWYSMVFLDVSIMPAGTQHAHGLVDKHTRVDFYYTPEFPILTVARAYAVAKYFRMHPELNYLLNYKHKLKLPVHQRLENNHLVDIITNQVCYPSWDINTFQAGKPDNTNKLYHPWFDFIYKAPEFSGKISQLAKKLNDFSAGLRDEYKHCDGQQMVGLRIYSTKNFVLTV